MTEHPRRNVRAIRDFLLEAFNAEELDQLFYFADDPDLREAEGQFLPRENLPVWVRKAVAYCERHDLLDQLLAEIERERPDQFHRLRETIRAAAALVLNKLPADLPDLTGRKTDVEQARTLLDQKGVLLISGMGGVGKTALAVRVARQLRREGRFCDAQLYLDLKGSDPAPVEPVDALESLVNAVAKPDPNRPRAPGELEELWREKICAKDALLILDNAADADQVRSLLPGCAVCAVLVTSRQRFNLPGVRRLDLDPLQSDKARALLQDLAPNLDDGGADQIAELCGRLPLALRVAGNYLYLNEDETPDKYAHKLANERTRLTQLRDLGDPDLDVAAVLSLSVDQLARDDAELYRAWALLSLFLAPFDLDAAADLWGETRKPEPLDVERAVGDVQGQLEDGGQDAEWVDGDVERALAQVLQGLAAKNLIRPWTDALGEGETRTRLQALHNRSLLTYDREADRWLLHDLVRLTALGAREGLDEHELMSAQLRLARHYAGVAYKAKMQYNQGGEGVLEGLALFDQEWPHIRAGQSWAAPHAAIDDEAAHISNDYPDAASVFLPLRLSPRDWIGWLKPALAGARRLGDQAGEANHLGSLGLAHKNLGEMERAIDYYQQALTLSREIGDRRNEATHLGNLGGVYQILGETDQAIDLFQQALDIAVELEDRAAEGSYLGSLGNAYVRLGKTEQAIDHFNQARQLHCSVHDRLNEGRDLGNLGRAYHRLGETEKAIDYLEQSLDIARQMQDRRGQGEALGDLGPIYHQQGDLARARKCGSEARTLFEALEDPRAELFRAWLAALG
jgi:tetratricopeptide (TPR) repeat protein